MSKKQEGTDAHGPVGSRGQRGHGGDDAWAPTAVSKEQSAEHNNARFDEAQAARDAQRNQQRGGK